MSGKALRFLLPAALLIAGCAIFPAKPSTAPMPGSKQVVPPSNRTSDAAIAETPRRTEPRRMASRPRPVATPTPPATNATSTMPATILTKPGTPAAQPVPLFRQAIVLANVRAAVAGLPSAPQAEFRQGLLTLYFRGTTPDQISAAVNRAMSVPEVARVQVIQAP